jgi:protein SSD1
VKQNAEQHALKMEVASRSVHDEKALFDEDDGDDEIVLGRDNARDSETSQQRLLSLAKIQPEFEGLRTSAGHKVQDIRELMTVPVRFFTSQRDEFINLTNFQVIVTADLTKSPPVIKVYSVNPYAEQRK